MLLKHLEVRLAKNDLVFRSSRKKNNQNCRFPLWTGLWSRVTLLRELDLGTAILACTVYIHQNIARSRKEKKHHGCALRVDATVILSWMTVLRLLAQPWKTRISFSAWRNDNLRGSVHQPRLLRVSLPGSLPGWGAYGFSVSLLSISINFSFPFPFPSTVRNDDVGNVQVLWSCLLAIFRKS